MCGGGCEKVKKEKKESEIPPVVKRTKKRQERTPNQETQYKRSSKGER
jgi:hypothetical protein